MLVGNPTLTRHPPFDDVETRSRELERQLAFLSRYFTPRTIFLNLGAGDGTLALRCASYVERVYALDVPQIAATRLAWPSNVRIVCSPGALPDAAVDLAFSDREPGLEAARNAHRSLVPGGVFFYMSLMNKDHARDLLSQAGFAKVRCYALLGNRAVRSPGFLPSSLVAGIKSR